MKETIKYLDESDYEELRKTLKSNYVTISSVGLAVFLVLFLYYLTWTNKLPTGYLPILIIVFLILIIRITRLFTKNLRLDIEQGQKIINEYVIEQKDSYLDKGPGIGGWNTKYFFVSGLRKIVINKELYDNAEIGDSILEHLAPKSQEFIKYEIKKKT
jgi:hypothetical protein